MHRCTYSAVDDFVDVKSLLLPCCSSPVCRHKFRVTCLKVPPAIRLNMANVQALAGHKSIKTTQRYLAFCRMTSIIQTAFVLRRTRPDSWTIARCSSPRGFRSRFLNHRIDSETAQLTQETACCKIAISSSTRLDLCVRHNTASLLPRSEDLPAYRPAEIRF